MLLTLVTVEVAVGLELTSEVHFLKPTIRSKEISRGSGYHEV